MYIPVILGTAREGRQSEKVANYILTQVKEAGLETKLLDVRDFRTEATTTEGPVAEKYKAEIEKADGLIIVTPEFNHSYPGELKMMLDMAYPQYSGKPVGLCGVSMGPFAGARVVELIKSTLIELQLVPIREALYFPMVQDLFDEKGSITDEAYKERVGKFLDQLKQYAEVLLQLRK